MISPTPTLRTESQVAIPAPGTAAQVTELYLLYIKPLRVTHKEVLVEDGNKYLGTKNEMYKYSCEALAVLVLTFVCVCVCVGVRFAHAGGEELHQYA